MNNPPRNPKRGIVLIATLISLMLVVGLILVLQSAALANTKVLKRLAAGHSSDLRKDSIRELMRPLVGDAMINFDTTTALKLNGTPFLVKFEGKTSHITAQDVDGLVDIYRSPQAHFEAFLPLELIELKQDLVGLKKRALSIGHALAQLGYGSGVIDKAMPILTQSALRTAMNEETISVLYQKGIRGPVTFVHPQPKRIIYTAN